MAYAAGFLKGVDDRIKWKKLTDEQRAEINNYLKMIVSQCNAMLGKVAK